MYSQAAILKGPPRQGVWAESLRSTHPLTLSRSRIDLEQRSAAIARSIQIRACQERVAYEHKIGDERNESGADLIDYRTYTGIHPVDM
jgi:hypothetical protein